MSHLEPIPTSRALVVIARPRRGRPPSKQLTVPQLRALAQKRGLAATTKHIRPELLAMLASGVYIRPAALDRQNAQRAAKRAAN